jgi:hypothetical protein
VVTVRGINELMHKAWYGNSASVTIGDLLVEHGKWHLYWGLLEKIEAYDVDLTWTYVL